MELELNRKLSRRSQVQFRHSVQRAWGLPASFCPRRESLAHKTNIFFWNRWIQWCLILHPWVEHCSYRPRRLTAFNAEWLHWSEHARLSSVMSVCICMLACSLKVHSLMWCNCIKLTVICIKKAALNRKYHGWVTYKRNRALTTRRLSGLPAARLSRLSYWDGIDNTRYLIGL